MYQKVNISTVYFFVVSSLLFIPLMADLDTMAKHRYIVPELSPVQPLATSATAYCVLIGGIIVGLKHKENSSEYHL